MAHLINLKTFADERGVLTVLDKVLPFDIKRIYYIHNVGQYKTRGGHCHFLTEEAMICMHGSCTVAIVSATGDHTEYKLDNPYKTLVVEPGDWHEIYDFENDAILMGIASTHYDHNDYSYQPLNASITHDPLRKSETIK